MPILSNIQLITDAEQQVLLADVILDRLSLNSQTNLLAQARILDKPEHFFTTPVWCNQGTTGIGCSLAGLLETTIGRFTKSEVPQ